MPKELGNVNKAYIKVSSSLVWLGGEQENSVDLTAEAIDTSDKDTVWASFIAGKRGATVNVVVHADTSDSAQEAAIDALISGEQVDWAVGKLGTGSSAALASGQAGKAIVTAINFSNQVGTVATRSLTLTATGEVSHT